MKKPNSVLVSFFTLALITTGCLPSNDYEFANSMVVFDNENQSTFTVYVADDPAERTTGLASVDILNASEGMLFLFPESGQYSFWMKEVQYPIDIIWLHDLVVVDITHNIQPESSSTPLAEYRQYRPIQPVNAVLELPAQTAKTEGLTVGNRLDIQR